MLIEDMKKSAIRISVSNLLILTLLVSVLNADVRIPKKEEIPLTAEEVEPYEILKEEEKEQKALSFQKGDWEGYFGATMRIEYYLYNNICYMNNKIPDQTGVFKQTIDLMFDLIYGKKKYGHEAFEFFIDLRSKQKWGYVGAYRNTSSTEIKFVDTSLGEHDHRSSRPIPWFKDAWMQFSFNSVFNSKMEELQFFKIGWFPFLLGRGIAFGASYATVYEELGLFSYYEDTSAPGIDINGELVKDTLYYDLYYAKFEDNTTTIGDTYNDLKKNHVGRRYNPWTGVGKDDELWAARLYWTAFDNQKTGRLDIEPYVFFNEASDQRVEFKKDCKTQLGSYGLGIEYGYKNFEMGGEVAFNFGTQKLYWIDRNQIVTVRRDDGVLEEQYDNVSTEEPSPYVIQAPVSKANKNIVDTSTNYNNLENIGDNLWNGKWRFRPQYKNHLHGWMGVIDAAYTIDSWDLKFATEFLYASGDYDPNEPGDHAIEIDKKYRGFIGLHEYYNGYRVKSALLTGERETHVPTALRPGLYEDKDGYYANSNTSLSDMIYLGFSATWNPRGLRSHNFKLNPNVICFWKEHESYKYVLDVKNPNNSHTSTTEKARRYLGTETNIIASIDLLRDLTVSGVISVFFTGAFFSDVKGVPCESDYFRKVLKAPNAAIPDANPADYRLSDDTALFFDIALTYKF